jgi:DNA polymerase
MAKVNKQAQLDKIKENIIKQNICPDLRDGATNLVFGDGSADANVVFVGEAPGKKEDEQGLPFVGAAGRFLDEMLSAAGLKRKDVYITNIVKYRPPNNRDPYPDEKAAFLPFLKQQLDVIDPKLVVTLGRHSMEVLLPATLKISQVHGQPKRYQGQVYMPLFHPAAALYSGSMKQTLIDDFLKIPRVLAKI